MSYLLRHHAGKQAASAGEAFSDMPPHTFSAKWLGGMAVPFVVALYAVRCVHLRTGLIIGRNGVLPLTGSAAVALGVSLAGAAGFLHAHYFWGNTRILSMFSYLGKIIGLCVFIGGLFAMIAFVLQYGA